jgi:hypothetical protein
MEMLKKYWYILVGLLVLFFVMKKKKTVRRRRRTMRPRYNMMRGMRTRYRSYSRSRMTRRRRK